MKPALLIDTINETKSREETDARCHTANLASDDPSEGEHLMNLTMILREICNFRQDVKEQLEDTKGEISKTDTRLDEVGARILENEERLQKTEEAISKLLNMYKQTQLRLTNQERCLRRENVRIYGVLEGAEGEPKAMIQFVEKLPRENLDTDNEKNMVIERAHRALIPKPPPGAQPRSILMKFLNYRMKEEVVRQAWQKKGYTRDNCKISIDRDYALRILARRRDCMEVRNGLKDKNLYPAHLSILYEDETKIYETAKDSDGEASMNSNQESLNLQRKVELFGLQFQVKPYTRLIVIITSEQTPS